MVDLQRYRWYKKFRGGTSNDRLVLFKKYTDTPFLQQIKSRIGSQSLHAEVFKSHFETAIKIAPMTEFSNNEKMYLDLLSEFVQNNECENFPLLYSTTCNDTIVYQNEKLKFDAFDNLVGLNVQNCARYISENLRLIDDESYIRLIKKKLSKAETLCDDSLSNIKIAWKVFQKKCLEDKIILPLIPKIMNNIFHVELAHGDLSTLLRSGFSTIDDLQSILFGAFNGLYFLETKLKLHHGDFHAGNVLVTRETPNTKTYNIDQMQYVLKDCKYLGFLWDFETVGNIRYENQCLKEDVVKLLYSLQTDVLIVETHIKNAISKLVDSDKTSWKNLFDAVSQL